MIFGLVSMRNQYMQLANIFGRSLVDSTYAETARFAVDHLLVTYHMYPFASVLELRGAFFAIVETDHLTEEPVLLSRIEISSSH